MFSRKNILLNDSNDNNDINYTINILSMQQLNGVFILLFTGFMISIIGLLFEFQVVISIGNVFNCLIMFFIQKIIIHWYNGIKYLYRKWQFH